MGEIYRRMAKNRKLRGTRGDDELTGTRRKNRVYGMGGNDSISTEEGRYSVWGGEGEDTFNTLDGGKGYMTIMDFEASDTITFCGCPATRIEQRGNKAWIVKGDDVKAVVKGVRASDLDIDFVNAVITMAADPLA
jgi:Ca2+-binding RTX toxin-like protein